MTSPQVTFYRWILTLFVATATACGSVESTPLVGFDLGEAEQPDEGHDAGSDGPTRPIFPEADGGAMDDETPDAGHDEPDHGPGGDAGPDLPDAALELDQGEPLDAGEAEGGATIQTFRVLHWNIAGGKENNCRTPGITRAVVNYVKDKNLDFVGLNEVCPAQYESIRDALRQHWGKGPNARFSAFVGDGGGRIVGNAIYSKVNIRDVTRHNVGADQYGDRNLLCARIGSFDHLRFCSVHLSPADSKATVQMGRVLDRLEIWWSERRDTVILAGDINLKADHPGLNKVYSAGANHPKNNPGNRGRYREVDDADPQHCPGYGERSLPGTTGGPCGEGGKIDFIFARENRIVNGDYSGNTFNIPATCAGRCSDHRAVFGRLKLRIAPN